MVVVTLSTFELALLTVRDLSLAREKLLDTYEMFDLFGFFLLVLVGMELITSLKEYVRVGAVQVEVVLEVALIALAQRVIILDPGAPPHSQFGLAALILALAGSFWCVRASRQRGDARSPRDPGPPGHHSEPAGVEPGLTVRPGPPGVVSPLRRSRYDADP
jgi:uncharacterized membrane protein (DUF373 family)